MSLCAIDGCPHPAVLQTVMYAQEHWTTDDVCPDHVGPRILERLDECGGVATIKVLVLR